MFCGYHILVYSTITGPTDGVDRVKFSVWYGFFNTAREVFGKHTQLQNEGLHLALNLVPVLVRTRTRTRSLLRIIS